MFVNVLERQRAIGEWPVYEARKMGVLAVSLFHTRVSRTSSHSCLAKVPVQR